MFKIKKLEIFKHLHIKINDISIEINIFKTKQKKLLKAYFSFLYYYVTLHSII